MKAELPLATWCRAWPGTRIALAGVILSGHDPDNFPLRSRVPRRPAARLPPTPSAPPLSGGHQHVLGNEVAEPGALQPQNEVCLRALERPRRRVQVPAVVGELLQEKGPLLLARGEAVGPRI